MGYVSSERRVVPLSSAIAMLNLVRFHRNVFHPTRTPQIIRLNYTVPPESPTTTPQQRRQRGSNDFQLRGMSFRGAAGSVSLCLDEHFWKLSRMISFFDSNVGVFLGRLELCQRKFLPKLWAETIRQKKNASPGILDDRWNFSHWKKHDLPTWILFKASWWDSWWQKNPLANLGWDHWCCYPVSH